MRPQGFEIGLFAGYNDLPSQNNRAMTAPLRVVVVGLGNFGQFIARGLKRRGHSVLVTSRSDNSHYCQQNRIQFFRNMDAMCEEEPYIILLLPSDFGIVCTHPMFGPESEKNGWTGLPFVFDKVRISENSVQERKCAQLLSIFEEEGCRMVDVSCEEHDRHDACSQFITHTIGRSSPLTEVVQIENHCL